MTLFHRFVAAVLIPLFVLSGLTPRATAQAVSLPEPGHMVDLSPAYAPMLLKGMTVHADNPLMVDFIADTGKSGLTGADLKSEGDRLVKYFFASMAIPEKNLWVNLSPYEKQRMIDQDLGRTTLGRDMLAEDYLLKQV